MSNAALNSLTEAETKYKKFPNAKFFKTDLCALDDLEDFGFMVFNTKIVGIKQLLGEDIVYFGKVIFKLGKLLVVFIEILDMKIEITQMA